ncbi:hypothetical protein [Fictibacillus sp. BK138]|uniref:hypothetical protein n=1 Tax=Fictibacillus sp. BK138 TaxID=2512121 RepID=UPI00102A1509|nr:hypothetical protein [Fictibacillus sp. BK138]RZT15485.1 hypothetical protein EV282_3688 [Fictibacillus sp. BK138]
MEQRTFYYNKANYILNLKSHIERYFKGKSMLQFGIALPYFVPFKDSTNVTYKVTNDVLNHFHFSKFNHTEPIYTGTYKEVSNQQQSINRTRVEMSYIYKKELKKDTCNEDYLTETFNLLLKNLNNIITSYILVTKDISVNKVKMENLDPIILFRLVSLKPYQEEYQGLFHLNFNKLDQNHENYLDTKKTDAVMRFIDTVGYELNPFTYTQELNLNARRYFKNGDFRQSVIESQTAVETFFTALYRQLLFNEENNLKVINEKVESIAFKNMVTHQFHRRLGGDFDITNKESIVGSWWKNTYLLRNKVVHEGFTPTSIQSNLCIEAVNNLFKFITDLLHENTNKDKYPALSEFLLKTPTI